MRIGSPATAASNRVDGYLPTEVLRAARWKTMSLRKLEPKQSKVRVFRPTPFVPKRIDMHVLRRGVVSFGHLAYLS